MWVPSKITIETRGLPIIRTEGDDGQFGYILEVAELEIVETVPNRYWLLDTRCANGNCFLIAIDLYNVRLHKALVFASDLEAHDTVISVETLLRMAEVKGHLILLDLHVIIDRALASDGVVAIGLVECHIGQSLTYGSLVLRMDLQAFIFLHQVVGRDHATMRD